MADAHKNFAVSLVATAPAPAASGTSLVVTAGHGTRFPAVPFNATIWPAASQPDPSNAEIVRITGISTDTFTITRAQESSSARTVVVGDQIAATITVKTLTDVEAAAGDLNAAVILAPASSARNVIQPTAGAVIAAIVKAHAAQSVDLTQWQDSGGVSRLAVTKLGELLQALSILDGGVVEQEYNANSLVTDFSLTLDPTSPTIDGVSNQAYRFLARNAVDAKQYHHIVTLQAETMFRGTKVTVGSQAVAHTALFALAQTDTPSTGSMTRLKGLSTIASHAGSGTIEELQGNYGFVSLADYGGAPRIATYMAAFVGETYVETTPVAVPDKIVFLALGGAVVAGTVTRASGLEVRNQGGANIVSSYGIRVLAQSGATTSYGLVVEGGKSLFTSGLVIALIAAPADAAYANGEGGWWWDQANSLPKWKGKTSGGVVVNFTPADATALADHISDAADAHDASAISFSPTGTIAATDVQAAIAEVASEAAAGGIPGTILDAKGDLIAATAADTAARLAVGTNGHVLTADSAEATGIKWAAAAGGGIAATLYDANTILKADTDDTPVALTMGASTILARLAAGSIKAATPAEIRALLDVVSMLAPRSTYYVTPVGSAITTGTLATGYIYAVPILFSAAFTADRIGLEVTTAGSAGALLRLGIYTDDGQTHPNALVLDAGTIVADTTGFKEITISQAITPGIYWLVAEPSVASSTARCTNIVAMIGSATSASLTGNHLAAYYKGGGNTGALPATWAAAAGTVANQTNSGAPRILVRRT